MSDTAQVPANIAPYVDALGIDDALHFILAMGGSELYLPKRSTPRSFAARTIGTEKVDRLAATLGPGYYKVPVARQWCASVLLAKGYTMAEIARTVRADYSTVRRWLGPQNKHEQLDLF
ncbi:helix-turn-helix domain-containing protein [Pelagibacterium halotolerans]|uniref:Uncharacterized protein n=1 Tax=Pelagibacterium halotolerans (strain DSM 22347 / JCM 15775 / CGMCC 1.7692 / B2) TaxID=1082931 RepID=G4RDE5_PELHB|nr:helix-turn-helix domain-containing protein [Pelagibacterium halotolerans]AEQ50771.1 hypothetical protein KKY_732 [Pelagibacterium halotolerans B2]QJR19311.1 helix-turn-helix domain-containing protein [Pelagibacterium halotolerans]SDZ95414.1 hypothetical protein SAMN05428936_101658 [Pelagibacterium halotolerans]